MSKRKESEVQDSADYQPSLDDLPKKELFRIDEVARHFDVSERCIRLWIEHKLLIAEQYRENGTIRVTRESILRFRFNSRHPE